MIKKIIHNLLYIRLHEKFDLKFFALHVNYGNTVVYKDVKNISREIFIGNYLFEDGYNFKFIHMFRTDKNLKCSSFTNIDSLWVCSVVEIEKWKIKNNILYVYYDKRSKQHIKFQDRGVKNGIFKLCN